MKYLFFLLSMSAVGTLYAQQDETENNDDTQVKKKPSWSTGLPERTAAPTIQKPVSSVGKPDFGNTKPDEVDMPTTDVSFDNELSEGFELPEISIGTTLPATKPKARSTKNRSNVITFDTSDLEQEDQGDATATDHEPVPPSEQVVKVRRQASIERSTNRIPSNYDWKILSMEPVRIPQSMIYSHKEVSLEVHINPQGEVVKVKRISDLTPLRVLNYSTKAMKNWQFEAPSNYGINDVISKNILIELVAR